MNKFVRVPEEKIKKIQEMLKNGIQHREIADKLSCSLQTITKIRKDLFSEVNNKEYLQDIDKKKSKQEIAILKRKNNELIEDIQQKEKMYETWKQVKQNQEKINIQKKKNKDKTESTAVIVASDWHSEEIIDPETVNGLNEYNLEISEDRATKFFQNSLDLFQMLEKPQNVKNVVFALLGDFISGYIHPELLEGNQMSPTEAIIFVKKLIIAGIDLFLKETEADIVVVTAFGNHGRTTDKKRVATGWKNNYEWLMYNMIAERYMENDRIKFKIEKGNHNYLQVYDKLLRFHHGDMVKYNGGMGGITIPVNKAIAQWNKAKRADYDIFGHRHQCKDGGNFVSNGSLIGYGPYAESIKADFEEPKQMMFLINSKFGKTITSPVLVVE